VALKHFPNIDSKTALNRPILYSNWLSKDYVAVEQEELRDFVKARLKVGSHSNTGRYAALADKSHPKFGNSIVRENIFLGEIERD